MLRMTLAVVLVLLAYVTPAQAQFAPKFGLIGGVNLTHIDLTDSAKPPSDIYHGKTAPGAGAVVLFPVANRIGIRMELMWLEKGQTISGGVFQDGLAGSLDLNYFEVPVLAVVDLLGGRMRPYVVAGPSFGFLLGAFITGDGGSSDIKYVFDAPALSVIGGGGVAYLLPRARLFIEARYAGGVNNIEAQRITFPGGSTSVNSETMKTKGVQIMIGVTVR